MARQPVKYSVADMDQSILESRVCDKLSYVEEFDALCINLKSTKYPAKQHARRTAAQLGAKSGLIYLLGQASVLYEDSDQPKVFRQRRYFYYLSGVDFENCVVTYDIEKDELRLFIPAINPATVIWLGATPDIEECEERYDVDAVEYRTDLDDYVSSWHQENPVAKIFALHPGQIPRACLAFDKMRESLNTTSLWPAMDAARVIKSDFEVDLIRKANDISSWAHRGVLEALHEAKNETQIEAEFLAHCVANNAKTQAYGIIAASGPNASTLHYQANNESLKGRQLVCLDAGCEWDCYASDVTRTFPISGEFSKEAQAIYDIVEEMQEECIKRLKPGVYFKDIHLLAMDIAVMGLMKLGVLHNGSFKDVSICGQIFFPHGLGHHLGLEVHDVTANQRLLDIDSMHDFQKRPYYAAFHPQPLPTPEHSVAKITTRRPYDKMELFENMIITVEPGIYFSRYALEEVYLKDSKYAKFINTDVLEKYFAVGGVRIEDDILITKDGYENLTTAPKGEEACKIIRNATEQAQMSEPKRYLF